MSIPYRFDDSNTERRNADALLDFGITPASLSASDKRARGDASVGLVGIGSAGAPSMNPLGVGPSPAPAFVQPGTNIAPATTDVPPAHLDALRTSPVAAPPYQQPNVITPASRAGTTPTRSNPMGL